MKIPLRVIDVFEGKPPDIHRPHTEGSTKFDSCRFELRHQGGAITHLLVHGLAHVIAVARARSSGIRQWRRTAGCGARLHAGRPVRAAGGAWPVL
jgi:hypothetical protein